MRLCSIAALTGILNDEDASVRQFPFNHPGIADFQPGKIRAIQRLLDEGGSEGKEFLEACVDKEVVGYSTKETEITEDAFYGSSTKARERRIGFIKGTKSDWHETAWHAFSEVKKRAVEIVLSMYNVDLTKNNATAEMLQTKDDRSVFEEVCKDLLQRREKAPEGSNFERKIDLYLEKLKEDDPEQFQKVESAYKFERLKTDKGGSSQ